MLALVTLKSKKYEPFIVAIKDFKFDEDDRKVIFYHCKVKRDYFQIMYILKNKFENITPVISKISNLK